MARRLLVFVAVWAAGGIGVPVTVAEHRRPQAGKSVIVADESLKKVDKLHRKVVFFQKDVDLPCLRVPESGEAVERFGEQVHVYELPGGNSLSCHAEMTKDGELIFLGSKAIFRVTKENRAETLVNLSELEISGPNKLPKSLAFDRFLPTPSTTDFIYVDLSTYSDAGEQRTDDSAKEYWSFVGRLDVKARQLRVLPTPAPVETQINPDAGWIYEIRRGAIECKDFDGKVVNRWQLSDLTSTCCPSPDKQSLLVCRENETLGLLDLKSGQETGLRIRGRVAKWGKSGTIFCISEKTNGDILDTSLFRYQIGEKEPRRLFLVSTLRKKNDGLLGVLPLLSADRSWLAWRLPVSAFEEYGTILLDLHSGEYRILKGSWDGVQWW